MSAREATLSRIRAALKAKPGDRREETAKARLAGHARGIVPQRGQLPAAERVEMFRAQAERVNATVAEVSDYDAVPAAVTEYLRTRNLPASVRMGDDPRLAGTPWDSERTLEVLKGSSDGTDLAGVSHAIAGVAETGSLALASGSDNPTSINFLPEHHLVVVSAADIDGDMETVFDRLRGIYGEGQMPRNFNFVTGPSRSGDIEQTMLLGAHGPRALHIIVVGEKR